MRKRILFLFILVCILFSGCSTKVFKGVPDSQVLFSANINVDNANRYEIIHDYDTDTHVDSVEIVLYYEDHFGTITTRFPYWFQYDRASDLWTIIREGVRTTEHEIDEEAYRGYCFYGTDENWIHPYDYSIEFIDIDTAQMTATIYYEITFYDNIPSLRDTQTVEIQTNTGNHILIPYEYENFAGTSMNTLWFDFNIESGLEAYN